VSRVAANLASTSREQVERGDVLTRPGMWRPTATVEVSLRPVRSIEHPLTARGAFKLHFGSGERDARVRLYGTSALRPGDTAYGRIRLSRPIVAAVGDRFVLREAGRRETVAGGVILDTMPPPRAGPDPALRLRRRAEARPEELPSVVVAERGRARATDLAAVTGSPPTVVEGAERVGRWWVDAALVRKTEDAVRERLSEYHRDHPLRPGMDAAELRRTVEPEDLGGEILERLRSDGEIVREGTVVRLVSHRVSLGAREDEARRLVDAVAGGEPSPPTVRELQEAGFSVEMVDACVATGRLLRVSPDLVITPGFGRALRDVARTEAARPEGLTVSRFREALDTSRKYAVPLLEWLDARRVTRRDGDVRRPGLEG
jgi:selenocysteine-specific elongation factor